MKLNFYWEEKQSTNRVDIFSHPINQKQVSKIKELFNQTLLLTEPSNNRKKVIPVDEIEAIISLGHLSKVTLINQENYFYDKRLKELRYLEELHFNQVNQSTIINLNEISSFQAEKHARLELITKSNQHYIVSRHYTKQLKERLLCLTH